MLTNDDVRVQLEGSFDRVDAYLARSAHVLSSVGDGPHRATFHVDTGRRGYYRVYAWWPQASPGAGLASIVVHGLGDAAHLLTVDQHDRGGQWNTLGTFELGATEASIEWRQIGESRLKVDAIRLEFIGTEPPQFTLDTRSLPLGVVGEKYEAALEATGGRGTVRFSVDVGQLPPGLLLESATGRVWGTPGVPGEFRFDVKAFDSGGNSASGTYTVRITHASTPADRGVSHGASKPGVVAKDGVAVGAAPDLSGLVALVVALPEGEWVRANLNAYSDVWTPADLRPLDHDSNPDPSRIILAWSSFAWNPNAGDLMLYGGGHANYSGNDVYRWRGSTRRWERASLPSEIKQDDLGNWQAVDGWDHAPSSAHTYDNNVFLPHVNRLVVFGGAAYNNGDAFMRQDDTGTASRRTGPFFFDPSRADGTKVGGSTGSHVQRVAPHPEIVGGNMWENRDIYVRIANTQSLGSFVNGCTAYSDESGRDVVYIGARPPGGGTALNLFKYTVNDLATPGADTVQLVGIYWNGTDDSTACAFDPVRKLLVRTGNNSIPFLYWNLSTPGTDNRDVRVAPIDPSGEFPALLASNAIGLAYCGLDFDPRRARFALWCGGGPVWMLTPPSSPSAAGWTIVKQRTPALAVPALSPGTGVLGKWKYVSNLDAFIGVEDINQGNVWIYKPIGWVPPASSANPTNATLSSSPNPTIAGAATLLTATVFGNAPTGTVSFVDDGEPISRCANVLLTGTGNARTATCTTNEFVAGSRSISAAYSGDTSNAPSTATLSLVVTAPVDGTNVALAANGATASASSVWGPSFSPSGVIDNERSGADWGNFAGWADGTSRTFPDWVQIDFDGAQTIDHVVVYSVQDNYLSPVEPTDSMTGTRFVVSAFDVQGWNGSAWVTLGSVTGNNRIKRTVSFVAYTTDRIRIVVSQTEDGVWSRITEVSAWSSTPGTWTNYARPFNGGSALASSTWGPSFPASGVIDGARSGANWGNFAGWADGTLGLFPDWLEIDFNGPKTIDHVVLYSVQDNYLNPLEPTDSMTGTRFVLTSFQVQGWSGSSWVNLATVTGNNLIKRTVSLPSYATSRLRVVIDATQDGVWSRVTEMEAWGR